jgi:hypothetical protein
MRPRQTGVNIVKASTAGDVTTTELHREEGKWPSEPVAPATMWTDETEPSRKVIELHRLVRLDGEMAVFESYGAARAPSPGGPYSLYSWFRPEQLRAIQDESLRCERRRYDGPPDESCLLTWADINPGDDAYVSDAGWITVDAYERFIRDDLLRVRAARG